MEFSGDGNTVDNIPAANDNGTNIVNGLTGLLTKAADTYLDTVAVNKKNQIGSVYPTGQVNPAIAKNQSAPLSSYAPWLIAGGVVLVIVVAFVALKK